MIWTDSKYGFSQARTTDGTVVIARIGDQTYEANFFPDDLSKPCVYVAQGPTREGVIRKVEAAQA